ncbi:MAG: YitT family protein [Myxococcales bacterium]
MLGKLTRLLVIVLASVLLAAAYNIFLLPFHLLSGGITGIAMIVAVLTELNTGWLIFALNVPIFLLGFFRLGKRFVFKSVVSVAVTSLAMQWIPQHPVTGDPILASVFGGVLVGIAIGVIFRAGGSTGGFDIIGMVLTQKKEFPLGELIFFMNVLVVSVAGFLFTWERALYTLVTMFATGKVVDVVHTRHIKLTLMIVTKRGEELRKRLVEAFYRGATVLDVEGAYSRKKRKMLVMVITRVELEDVKQLIRTVDPSAFVNITETVEIMGRFHKQAARKPHPLPHDDLPAMDVDIDDAVASAQPSE